MPLQTRLSPSQKNSKSLSEFRSVPQAVTSISSQQKTNLSRLSHQHSKQRHKIVTNTMGGEGEDLEPLFDYHRVQPSNFVCIDDDESDVSEVLPVKKRAKISQNFVKEDEDVKVIQVAADDDWLPPPPKVVFNKSKESGEDSTIKALRSKKMELMSYANTVVDVRQEAEESAKKEAEQVSVKPPSEAAEKAPQGVNNERAKIIITIQDKDGQKQFRVYADEKFERVFKMYTDKEKLDPKDLAFTFDGDKINPSSTPSNLDMEEGDMIEVHTRKR